MTRLTPKQHRAISRAMAAEETCEHDLDGQKIAEKIKNKYIQLLARECKDLSGFVMSDFPIDKSEINLLESCKVCEGKFFSRLSKLVDLQMFDCVSNRIIMLLAKGNIDKKNPLMYQYYKHLEVCTICAALVAALKD